MPTTDTQKRIVSIQDISCFGKCSLTVALPIISAAGIETVILPTAILSTHTAGFPGYTFRDLTDDIKPIADHWASIPLEFDSIYTGYLGSLKQIQLVANFFDQFRSENTSVIIDPVMGDNGRLYSGFTDEFVFKMAELCSKADYILPNMTEACLMLDIPYKSEDYDRSFIENILHSLCALGAKNAILTGVSLDLENNTYDPSLLGVAAYSAQTDRFTYFMRPKIDCSFHGTGDIFASVFASSIVLNGSKNKNQTSDSIFDATKLAADFVCDCIRATMNSPSPCNYGVNFEVCLPKLIKALELI